jgi:hypothetical protein
VGARHKGGEMPALGAIWSGEEGGACRQAPIWDGSAAAK